jgi:hypothetical protein
MKKLTHPTSVWFFVAPQKIMEVLLTGTSNIPALILADPSQCVDTPAPQLDLPGLTAVSATPVPG